MRGNNGQISSHYVDYLSNQLPFEGWSKYPATSSCSLVSWEEMKKIPENEDGTTICRFSPSLTVTCSGSNSTSALSECLSDTWYCVIPTADEVCSGKSVCLWDECDCAHSDTELFYCGDGEGCVTMDLTCDGNYDCLDKSDELVCDGLHKLTCKNTDVNWTLPFLKSVTVELTKFRTCSEYLYENVELTNLYPFSDCDTTFCDKLDLSGTKVAGYEKLHNCFGILYQSIYEIYDDVRGWLSFNITAACLDQCKGTLSQQHCQNLAFGMNNTIPGTLLSFQCSKPMKIGNWTAPQQIEPTLVCNGMFDCQDKSDEMFCLDRFYCSVPDENSSLVTWVSSGAVCNSYKDCKNGLDECRNCTNGKLSSDQFIVRNHSIFAWLIVSCLANLLLNAYVFWDTVRSDISSQPNHVKVDQILKLLISLYDMLLGFYLLALIIENVNFWGEYCLADDQWRSGWICKSLGMLYNFSSHGSLLTVLLMSVTRAYKCKFSYSQGMRLRTAIISSIFIALISLIHSIIPIIPSESIQNTFRTKLTISHSNPFIMSDLDNLDHIDRIYSQYFGETNNSDDGLYDKFIALESITNRPEFFGYRELSFYSWSPVCVQDLYVYRDSLKVYKGVYIIFIVLVMIILTVSYAKIIQLFHKSRRNIHPAGQDNEESLRKIKEKVALIIGTKIVSWMTIVGAMIYYHVTRNNVPNGWFEATAICIIPANSLMNPLIHSGILQSMRNWIRFKVKCYHESGKESTADVCIEPQNVEKVVKRAVVEELEVAEAVEESVGKAVQERCSGAVEKAV